MIGFGRRERLVFTRMIAALATTALCLALSTPTRADEAGRRYMNSQCVAALRDRPSLRRDRLASARFRMVEDVGGSEPGPGDAPVDLWFRHGEETARLPGGVALKVELGGCETFSNAYEFRFRSEGRALSDRAWWLARAAKLMATVESVSGQEPIDWTELRRLLLRRSPTSAHASPRDAGKFYWEREIGGDMGVGVRTYQVEAHDDGKTATLKVRCNISL